jgi:tRNA (guanine-N7-)-methyltransferase
VESTHIRTFKVRKGRMTEAQIQALERTAVPLVEDFTPLPFTVPTVLEIGFGFGDATIALALAQPEVNVIAVDVHTPGIAQVLLQVEEHGLDNLMLVEGDAILLLQRLPASSLTGVRAFFPDPWPKSRHHKRRLISPENLELMSRAVMPGGFLHVATDWVHYAESARTHLEKSTTWELAERHALADPATRPTTRFERRGIRADHVITDIVAVRR